MMATPERELHHYIAATAERADVRAGTPLPLGAQETAGGVNFALFSRHASRVRLELFDHPDDGVPARVIDLDAARHRTGDVWHVWVKGIGTGQLYAYRVDGPYEPGHGHRFNVHRLLLDPCATAITRLPQWDFESARGYDGSTPEDVVPSTPDNSRSTPKCVFLNEPFDWQGDQPPQHPWSKTVIYETPVRGFTRHPTSGVDHPGTYRGLMEKIPYLTTLGVTAVELMPVQEFNDASVTRTNPHTRQPLRNYWGYDPVVFRAPKASYSSAGGVGQQKLEFKEMVRACHKAGIEVILDVVFNHTSEPLLDDSPVCHVAPRSSVILVARRPTESREPMKNTLARSDLQTGNGVIRQSGSFNFSGGVSPLRSVDAGSVASRITRRASMVPSSTSYASADSVPR